MAEPDQGGTGLLVSEPTSETHSPLKKTIKSKVSSSLTSSAPRSRPKSPFITDVPHDRIIDNGNNRPQIQKRKVQSQISSSLPPKSTNEELSEALSLFEKKKTLPVFSIRDEVLQYAKNLSLQYLVEEDYDSAQKNDDLIAELMGAYLSDTGDHLSTKLSKSIESRIEEVQTRHEEIKDHYDQMIKEMKEQEKMRFNDLLLLQEEERAHFQSECQKPEFLQQFSKPSNKLLQMRKIQKSLALSHKFEDAKEVKRQADELQQQETIVAQKQAIDHIKSSYEQIIDKHKMQIECFNKNSERKMQNLASRFENEQRSNLNLQKQLESRLKDAKLKKNNLPHIRKSAPPTTIGQPSLLAIRQLVNYKKTPEMSQLEVQLSNINAVLRKKSLPTVPKNL